MACSGVKWENVTRSRCRPAAQLKGLKGIYKGELVTANAGLH